MIVTSTLFIAAAIHWQEPSSADSIKVPSVVVTLIDQVDVPARESGVLGELNVRPGDLVNQGDLLGEVDDTQAVLALRRAEVEVEIARQKAGNDISVRYAGKKAEVVANELRRAEDSRRKLKNSVSDTEFDRLKLLDQESTLQIEQAEHELTTEKLNLKLKERDLEIAAHDVERRKILAPLSGMVLQVKRQAGEWVQPGAAVVRILRVDRLRAEGFLQADEVAGNPSELDGRDATLTVSLPGRASVPFRGSVTFVSPEINPVNGQIRIWADFDNPRLELHPGMKGRLTIHPTATAAEEKTAAGGEKNSP